MKDTKKTKKQLIDELVELRRQIGELKRTKINQHGDSDKYLSILKDLPDIVYKIDPKGHFKFINNSVRVLGYKPEELIGEHFSKIIHPDDVKAFGRLYILPKYEGKVTGDKNAPKLFDERRTGPRKTKELEIRLISKNWKKGKKTLREFVGTVIASGDVTSTGQYDTNVKNRNKKFLGSLGVIRDITERKQMEDALRESEARYRDLVEKAEVAILTDDIEGKFKYYNGKFADLFGYSYDEIKSQSIETLVHPDDLKMVMNFHMERIQGRKVPTCYEIRGVKKDSSTIHLEVHVVALEDKNKIVGSRSYIWDVTERKQIENELRIQSLQDALTGLHNRRGFTILAEQQLKLANRKQKGFLMLFADLDRMKWINDNFGHKQGDSALKDVADILRNIFRESDIIARIGGDEFAILAVESHEGGGKILTKRLQKNLKKLNKIQKYPYKLSVSIGTVYCDPEKPASIDELLARADALMYKQKRHKK